VGTPSVVGIGVIVGGGVGVVTVSGIGVVLIFSAKHREVVYSKVLDDN
jgi:hypothetical protein